MRAVTLLVLLVGAACTGGRHKRGDQQAVFQASFGEPIEGRSLGFRGNGVARNVGVAAGGQWFLRDRWALGDEYSFPGAIQYFGPPEVCARTTRTLSLGRGR